MKTKKTDKRGTNPNSLANLKSFTKDKRPKNPGAKKGSTHVAVTIQKYLDAAESILNPITKKKERLTQIEIMVLGLIGKSRKGDVRAFKELVDRVYGQAEQNINFLTSQSDKAEAEITNETTDEEASRIYRETIKKSKGEL